jgi:probable DNA metabolism protein
MKTPENFMEYLAAHRDCTEEILDYAAMLTAEDIETSLEPQVARIKKMVYAVKAEIHRMRGFVRLTPLGENILHGYLEPEHNTGRQITTLMAKRFPKTTIILGNLDRTWTANYSDKGMKYIEGEGIIQTIGELDKQINEAEGNEMNIEKLWATYYYSQYCADRRNPTLFRKHMPEKSIKAAGLVMEQRGEYAPMTAYC